MAKVSETRLKSRVERQRTSFDSVLDSAHDIPTLLDIMRIQLALVPASSASARRRRTPRPAGLDCSRLRGVNACLPLETLDLGVQLVELLLLGEGGGGEAVGFGFEELGEPAQARE